MQQVNHAWFHLDSICRAREMTSITRTEKYLCLWNTYAPVGNKAQFLA